MSDRRQLQNAWFASCSSLEELHEFLSKKQGSYMPGVSVPDALAGRCGVCRRDALFLVESEPDAPVNWRETLHCTGCGLFARLRACLHLVETIDRPSPEAALYLTEGASRFYDAVRARYPHVEGSEFDASQKPGQSIRVSGRRVRNEDITRLTYDDQQFQLIVCQDVLEHVPEYPAALRELFRVLSPGGSLYLTVPFTFGRDTLVRAELGEDGELVHHLPPMYHLDPANPDGVLCFQDFGTDLLDRLRDAGFDDAVLIGVRDPHWGYVGGDVIFRATRNA